MLSPIYNLYSLYFLIINVKKNNFTTESLIFISIDSQKHHTLLENN